VFSGSGARAGHRLPRWLLPAGGLLAIAAGVATLLLVLGRDPEDRAGSRAAGGGPSVSWRAPGDSQQISGVLSGSRCEVLASDEDGMRGVRFYVDDRYIGSDGSPPYNCRWETATSPGGPHTLKVEAVDAVRTSSVSSRRVTVTDETEPAITPKPASTPEPAPPPAGSLRRWRGDFETGTLSQWDDIQWATENRVRVVRSPVVQGRYAARFASRRGEFTGGDVGSNRTEIVKSRPSGRVGGERWYRWFTMLAPDFPRNHPDDFCSIMQWKRVDNANPLPLGFGIHGRNLRIASDGTRYLGPISRGKWHEFVVHVNWSSDPDVGFLEVWMDDRRILPRRYLRNVYLDSSGKPIPHYLKQGLYKSDNMPSTYVYHDGMAIGGSRREVDPSR